MYNGMSPRRPPRMTVRRDVQPPTLGLLGMDESEALPSETHRLQSSATATTNRLTAS